MTPLLRLHDRLFDLAETWIAPWAIPTLGRLVFAGVLLSYFWTSAATKLGDGLFGVLRPSIGAYAQIYPKAFEAVGYAPGAMGWLQWLVVVLGTWAEFILPALIVIGLATRMASLGMIGFIVMMSLTDIHGHGADAATIGAWFDRASAALIVDQRSLWVFLLLVMVFRGGGPLSADGALRWWRARRAPVPGGAGREVPGRAA